MSRVTLLRVLVLLCVTVISVQDDFSISPSSQSICEGELATFQCQHFSAVAIQWIVNGSLVGSILPPNITRHIGEDAGGNRLDMLSIGGVPRYNGFEIRCSAILHNVSRNTSPPAFLHVTMECMSDPDEHFIVVPTDHIMAQDGTALFMCQHASADAIDWRVNGERINTNSTDIEASSKSLDDGGVLYTLTIVATPKYNLSNIRCVASFFNGSPAQLTTAAHFFVQGKLEAVSKLSRISDGITWEPPFSLNLTGVDPNIVYCVEVYNITCGRRDLIISDCNVTKPCYISDDIALDGYINEYVVIPRSNVPGVRNGTPSQPLREQFSRFTMLPSVLFVTTNDNRDYRIILSWKELNFTVPSFYTLSLLSLDGLEDIDSVETNTSRTDNLITLNVVPGLPPRRLWNCTILAYGCQNHPVLSDIELSTHDFRDVVTCSFCAGDIVVTGSFSNDSTASGILIIVVNNSDIYYHKAIRDGDTVQQNSIAGIPNGRYHVSIFTVEENGLPFERAATISKSIRIETNDTQPYLSSIVYELHSKSTGVCITCTFLDNSTTNCVAVVHQRISQLSSSGLMNIESSHKFNRSGDTAYGCINGTNLDDQQVGVIGAHVQRTPHETDKNMNIWSFVIAALFTLIVLVLIFAVGFVIYRKKCVNQDEEVQNVELREFAEGVQRNRQSMEADDSGVSNDSPFRGPTSPNSMDRENKSVVHLMYELAERRSLTELTPPYAVIDGCRKVSQNMQLEEVRYTFIDTSPTQQQQEVDGQHEFEIQPTIMSNYKTIATDKSQPGSSLSSRRMEKISPPIPETYSDMKCPSYDEYSMPINMSSKPMFLPEGATYSSDYWCSLSGVRVYIQGDKMMISPPKNFLEGIDVQDMYSEEYSHLCYNPVENVNTTTQEMNTPSSSEFRGTEPPFDDGRRNSGITLYERPFVLESSSVCFKHLSEEAEVALCKLECDLPQKTATDSNASQRCKSAALHLLPPIQSASAQIPSQSSGLYNSSDYISCLGLRIPDRLADISIRKVNLQPRHCLMDSDFNNKDATVYPRADVTPKLCSHIDDEFDIKDSQQSLRKLHINLYDISEANKQESGVPCRQMSDKCVELQSVTVSKITDGYDKKKVRKKISEDIPRVSDKPHVEQPDAAQLLAVKLVHGLLSNVSEGNGSYDVQNFVDFGGLEMKLEVIPSMQRIMESIYLYLAETAAKSIEEPPIDSDSTEDNSDDEQHSLSSQPELSVVYQTNLSSDELIGSNTKRIHIFHLI